MIYIKVDEILKKKEKSRYWLAKQVQTDQMTIKRYAENDLSMVNLDMLDRICAALEIEDFNEILERR